MVLYVEGGVGEGTVLFAPLSASFQSLPWLPAIQLGISGTDSQVGGLVYILGPLGLSKDSPVRLGVSLSFCLVFSLASVCRKFSHTDF